MISDVLILSKTKMGSKYCVGGMISNGSYLRLLTESGDYQPYDTQLNVRQVWTIDYSPSKNVKAPHVEDVLVKKKKRKGQLSSTTTIFNFINNKNVTIWRGSPLELFDGLLKWTNNNNGYICSAQVPEHSVGFWISDSDLILNENRYSYSNGGVEKGIKYVGAATARKIIPVGTLIRVSLAKWWAPQDTDIEERCYLQLSGWYDK